MTSGVQVELVGPNEFPTGHGNVLTVGLLSNLVRSATGQQQNGE
jgi:hypothetical protein